MLRKLAKAIYPRTNAVDILGIGAQKSATSWAAYALGLHKNVWIPRENALSGKEVMFWNIKYSKGLDWYKRTMTPPWPTMKSMDVSPGYTTVELSKIHECYSQSPKASVFLLLRNPIYRDWSSLAMEANLRDKFDLKNAGTEEIREYYHKQNVARYSTYTQTLAAWKSVYGERLFVGLYDDIVANQLEFYEKLCAHCGLEPNNVIDWRHKVARTVFKGPEVALPAEIRNYLKSIYAPMIGELQDMLKRDLSDWLSERPKVQ